LYQFVSTSKLPLLLDADALKLLAQDGALQPKLAGARRLLNQWVSQH